MISILISWIVSGFIFLSLGKAVVNLFSANKKSQRESELYDAFFIGVCFVGAIITATSLFFPINTAMCWYLFIFSILYTLYLYKYKNENFIWEIIRSFKNQSTLTKVLLSTALITILAYALLPPNLPDTRLYYLQSMMWTEAYPVIPGLANVHGRFGFNSNILTMSSAFTFSDIFGFRLYSTISLCMLVFVSWLIKKIAVSENILKSVSLVFFVSVFMLCYSRSMSSSSTDILPNLMASYLLLKLILEKNALRNNPLLFWVLSIFIVTLKLSLAPTLIIGLLALWLIIKQKNCKWISLYLILGAFIAIPWITRNIILTGYIFYPFPALDLFNFDWEIPKAFVETEKALVSSWAKYPNIGLYEFQKLSFTEWFTPWILRLWSESKIMLFVLMLTVASTIFMCWEFLFQKDKRIQSTTTIAWSISLIGTIFWFIMAPDIRFACSFILILAITPFLFRKNDKVKKPILKITTIIFCLSFLLLSLRSIKAHLIFVGDKSIVSYLYSPQTIEIMNELDSATFTPHYVGNMTIFTPNTNYCSDHKAICTPEYLFNDNIEMRGETFREGFRIRK